MCEVDPDGVFLTIWESYPDFRAVLRCPLSAHPRIEPAAWEVETAYQPFEHGMGQHVITYSVGRFDKVSNLLYTALLG